MGRNVAVALLGSIVLALGAGGRAVAQTAPADLWTGAVMEKIRDRSTLNAKIIPRAGHFEVFYDSEIGDANWADAEPPYEVHRGGTIRIHGYLATPLVGGPYPGLVVGHGHGGRGEPQVAMALAALGYVALAIDGPGQGQSTGGPRDSEQAWVSVEERMNEPSPDLGYLYHYAYAGMRGLTLLEHLARLTRPYRNPYRIDRDKLGVIGASMGGQFTYYINGVDSRVKGAVAIAVAGDWRKLLFHPGSWLYHGLYYHTRDGLPSGQDDLNTISDVCLDPTMTTFLDYFDPIRYAPTQHGPLLTVLGTHDQYFPLPAINTTFDRVASAGTHPRFAKNIILNPDGKHGVVRDGDDVRSIIAVIQDVHSWLRFAFHGSVRPPDTPTVSMAVDGSDLVFSVAVSPGSRPIRRVDLSYATQIDTFPVVADDFASTWLRWDGGRYVGRLPIGTLPPNGPEVSADNVLYFATVRDWAGFTITSKMYYRAGVLSFCDDFVPQIEHYPGDDFPVLPPPSPDCSCPGIQ